MPSEIAQGKTEALIEGPTYVLLPSAPVPGAPAPPPSVATAAVPASLGRGLFVDNGCAACHGPNGEGTRFAPTLTGIIRKYPAAQLTSLLRHPTNKMRDGGMPVVNLPDAGLQQLIVYLSTLGAIPSSSASATTSPAYPSATQPTQRLAGSAQTVTDVTRATNERLNALPLTPEAQRGRAIFERNGCESCHGIGGLSGTVAAPGLAGTASILPAKTLEDLLRHHSKPMQRGGMPLTNMNSQDMNAVIAFIRSLPNTSQ